jgi:uncharacterized protein YutE (UPF0331/DUF86 family)
LGDDTLTVDTSVVELRLDAILSLLASLKQISGMSIDTYLRDGKSQAASERWMQVAAQAVLDVASHFIAHNHWGTPQSYSESVARLGEKGVITSVLAERLVGLVKLRNVLVHQYANVDPRLVHGAVKKAVVGLPEFVKSVRKYLRKP